MNVTQPFKTAMHFVAEHPGKTALFAGGAAVAAVALAACGTPPRGVDQKANDYFNEFDSNHDSKLNTEFETKKERDVNNRVYMPPSYDQNGNQTTPGYYSGSNYHETRDITAFAKAADRAPNGNADGNADLDEAIKLLKTFDIGDVDKHGAVKQGTAGNNMLEGSEIKSFTSQFGVNVTRSDQRGSTFVF